MHHFVIMKNGERWFLGARFQKWVNSAHRAHANGIGKLHVACRSATWVKHEKANVCLDRSSERFVWGGNANLLTVTFINPSERDRDDKYPQLVRCWQGKAQLVFVIGDDHNNKLHIHTSPTDLGQYFVKPREDMLTYLFVGGEFNLLPCDILEMIALELIDE